MRMRDAVVGLEGAKHAPYRALPIDDACCPCTCARVRAASFSYGLSSARASTAIGGRASGCASACSSQNPKWPVKKRTPRPAASADWTRSSPRTRRARSICCRGAERGEIEQRRQQPSEVRERARARFGGTRRPTAGETPRAGCESRAGGAGRRRRRTRRPIAAAEASTTRCGENRDHGADGADRRMRCFDRVARGLVIARASASRAAEPGVELLCRLDRHVIGSTATGRPSGRCCSRRTASFAVVRTIRRAGFTARARMRSHVARASTNDDRGTRRSSTTVQPALSPVEQRAPAARCRRRPRAGEAGGRRAPRVAEQPASPVRLRRSESRLAPSAATLAGSPPSRATRVGRGERVERLSQPPERQRRASDRSSSVTSSRSTSRVERQMLKSVIQDVDGRAERCSASARRGSDPVTPAPRHPSASRASISGSSPDSVERAERRASDRWTMTTPSRGRRGRSRG